MPARIVKLVRRGPTPDVVRRQHNEMAKEAWDGCGYVWGESMRPQHFTRGAIAAYKYRRRSQKYEERKERKFGHRDPLVYTGESRERSGAYRVRATRYGATVTMQVPRINWSRRGDELRTISRTEARQLGTAWAQGYDLQLTALRSATSTTETGG